VHVIQCHLIKLLLYKHWQKLQLYRVTQSNDETIGWLVHLVKTCNKASHSSHHLIIMPCRRARSAFGAAHSPKWTMEPKVRSEVQLIFVCLNLSGSLQKSIPSSPKN
jgi:hypothetical protein